MHNVVAHVLAINLRSMLMDWARGSGTDLHDSERKLKKGVTFKRNCEDEKIFSLSRTVNEISENSKSTSSPSDNKSGKSKTLLDFRERRQCIEYDE